ncbi:MAG: hypothetical protein IPG02_00080 [Ignavibacteria bacterium]|nr:hypothetical protein [Ignavibacteria bacterium]
MFRQRGGSGVSIHSILDGGDRPEERDVPEAMPTMQSNVFEHSRKSEYEGFNVWQFSSSTSCARQKQAS